MILAWMAYCVVISLLLGCAALVAEYGLRLYGRPVRWLWIGAFLASLGLPAAARLLPADGPLPPELLLPMVNVPIVESLLSMESSGNALQTPWLHSGIDGFLLVLWFSSSALLLILYIRSYLRLRGEHERCSIGTIRGRRVLLSRTLGPAVGGFFRSFIVLPTWALDLDEEVRRMIVRHEEEHLRAWDHRVLLAAASCLLMAPWNLPLWWHYRRLRLAVEFDCDRRLLNSGVRGLEYGELLLEVGRRTSRTGILPAAFSEPRSLLERRFRNMTPKVHKHRHVKGTVAAIVAGALTVLACETPTPVTESIVEFEGTPPKLTGIVSDAASGAPLAGVKVYLVGSGRGALSADNGRFFLVNLEPGDFELVAEHPGYLPARFQLAVVENGIRIDRSDSRVTISSDLVELSIALKPAPGNAPNELVPALGQKPVFTPYTEIPSIENRREAIRIVEQNYPKLLKDAGIGGTSIIWVFIDADGVVRNAEIQKSSGNVHLDEAALKSAREFQFNPARNRGTAVAAWIALPIRFSIKEQRPPSP
jgi:TonB family protein